MIGIIKRRAERGFAFTVNEKQYAERIGPRQDVWGDAYCKCLVLSFNAVTEWADESAWPGKVSYVFESGHASQTRANRMMQGLFNIPALKETHRYLGHSFVDKRLMPGLQAADILAWQWAMDFKRRQERKTRRLDLDGLLELRHTVLHFSDSVLDEYRKAGDVVAELTKS
jgi:hypothetical protein